MEVASCVSKRLHVYDAMRDFQTREQGTAASPLCDGHSAGPGWSPALSVPRDTRLSPSPLAWPVWLWPGCWKWAHITFSFLLEAKSHFFLWRPGLESLSANECKPSVSSNGKSGMTWQAVACFQWAKKSPFKFKFSEELKAHIGGLY